MRAATLRAVPFEVATALFVALSLSYIDINLRLRGRLALGASDLYLALLIFATAGTLLRAAWSAHARSRLVALYTGHRAIILPLIGIAVFAFISALLPTAHWDQGAYFPMLPIYDAIVVLLAMLIPVDERRRRHLRWYIGIAFLILLGSIGVDVVQPGTFSMVEFRAAGFATNPNVAAFVLVSLCCAMISFDQVRVIDLGAVLLTGLGVLATLSRAGALLFAFLLACYCYRAVQTSQVKLSRLVVRLVGIGSMVAVAAAAGVALVRQAAVFQLPSSRLSMLFGRTPVLPADDPRAAVFAESWRLIREAPLLGHGGGYSNRVAGEFWEGPHNVYLQQWINGGLGGLVCIVWLLVASASVFFRRRSYSGMVFTGLAAIQGFFSHSLLDERAFLFLLGVLLTTSYFAAPGAARLRRVAVAGRSFARAPSATRPHAVAVDGMPSRSGSPRQGNTRLSP